MLVRGQLADIQCSTFCDKNYSEARATIVHGATATRDAIAGLAYHFDAGDYVDAPAVPIDSDAHPKLTIGGWIKVSMIVCN
jgi:hypothetical protein